MSEDNTYNGWTNYETWNWNLWVTNDESRYKQIKAVAEQCYRDARDGDAYGSQTREQSAAYALAQYLEQDCDSMRDNFPPAFDAGPFADLLEAAVGRINWYEIAEHWISDLDPEDFPIDDE